MPSTYNTTSPTSNTQSHNYRSYSGGFDYGHDQGQSFNHAYNITGAWPAVGWDTNSYNNNTHGQDTNSGNVDVVCDDSETEFKQQQHQQQHLFALLAESPQHSQQLLLESPLEMVSLPDNYCTALPAATTAVNVEPAPSTTYASTVTKNTNSSAVVSCNNGNAVGTRAKLSPVSATVCDAASLVADHGHSSNSFNLVSPLAVTTTAAATAAAAQNNANAAYEYCANGHGVHSPDAHSGSAHSLRLPAHTHGNEQGWALASPALGQSFVATAAPASTNAAATTRAAAATEITAAALTPVPAPLPLPLPSLLEILQSQERSQ